MSNSSQKTEERKIIWKAEEQKSQLCHQPPIPGQLFTPFFCLFFFLLLFEYILPSYVITPAVLSDGLS